MASPDRSEMNGKPEQVRTQFSGHKDLLLELQASNKFYWEPTPEHVQEVAQKRREITALFQDPEAAQRVTNGMDISMSMLKERERSLLRTYYRLDGPDTPRLTHEQLGRTVEPPLSRSRIGQIVGKATRQLRHPARAKHYLSELQTLPSFKRPEVSSNNFFQNRS